MKQVLYTVIFMATILMPINSKACITCSKKIQEAIFDSQFYPNLLAMLSPFIVLGILVATLSWLAAWPRNRLSAHENNFHKAWVPVTAAATVTGIGLGGFVDGIVLHQILQWHQMLSNKIAPITVEAKSVNMFWDGIFHLFTLLVTLAGVVLIWRLLHKNDINRSGWLFSGGLLMGWTLFNIIEGLADHHILKLHNVREITPHTDFWNYGFLLFSVVLGFASWGMIQKGRRAYKVELQ